jgi:hypothetical protein
MKRNQKNKFKDNLVMVALDEAHTLWSWRSFRKVFSTLRELRPCFPKIPVCALSATFPPHVVRYVAKTMGMPVPTHMITVDGRRSNINLVVSPQLPGKGIQQLHDIIPEGIKDIKDIPKTLIFVDTVLEARNIARSMRRCLWSRYGGANRLQCRTGRIIRSYYSCLSKRTKDTTLEWFRNGTTRITIATDAFSLGVDIADIDKVIQWGVDGKLDLSTLVQRIGRAARSPESQGVAVIYASRKLIDPIPRDWQEGWTTPIGGKESGPASEDEMWETEDQVQCIGNFRERDISKFSIPVTKPTIDKVTKLRMHMYKVAASADSAIEEDHMERKGSLIVDGRAVGGKKKTHEKIDPSVLWFLNTVGCRNRLILAYLDYPDIFADERQKSWCCDVCAWEKTSDPATDMTHGVKLGDSIVVSLGPKSAPKKKSPKVTVQFEPDEYVDIAPKVRKAIEHWRAVRLATVIDGGLLCPGLPPSLILPDSVMEAVVKSACNVLTVDFLRDVLTGQDMYIGSGTMREKDVTILYQCIQRVIVPYLPVNGTIPLLSVLLIMIDGMPAAAKQAQKTRKLVATSSITDSSCQHQESTAAIESLDKRKVTDDESIEGMAKRTCKPVMARIMAAAKDKAQAAALAVPPQISPRPEKRKLAQVRGKSTQHKLSKKSKTGQKVDDGCNTGLRKPLVEITNINTLRQGQNGRIIKHPTRYEG